jgi:hypothetical protein
VELYFPFPVRLHGLLLKYRDNFPFLPLLLIVIVYLCNRQVLVGWLVVSLVGKLVADFHGATSHKKVTFTRHTYTLTKVYCLSTITQNQHVALFSKLVLTVRNEVTEHIYWALQIQV